MRLLLGTGVARIEGRDAVEAVVTTDGHRIPCGLVVMGVGRARRRGSRRTRGSARDGGVLVDARQRTSAPDVFAAGDVTDVERPLLGRRLHVEHWADARHQGTAAARNVLGIDTVHGRIPYFFSDQYEAGMDYSGDPGRRLWAGARGDPDAYRFVALWLAGDPSVAGMHAGVREATEPIQRLIPAAPPVGVAERAEERAARDARQVVGGAR